MEKSEEKLVTSMPFVVAFRGSFEGIGAAMGALWGVAQEFCKA